MKNYSSTISTLFRLWQGADQQNYMDKKTEDVMAEILGRDTSWMQDSQEPDRIEMSPGFDDLKALAEILASDPDEEQLQEFLQFRPKLIMGFSGGRYSGDLALLIKPPVGIGFRADFGILQANQSGAHIGLIEIERSNVALFTKRGTPAQTLQTAIGQIQDWQQWLRLNYPTFIREIMGNVKKLPKFPSCTHNGSCRFRSVEEIERTWQMYGGYESATLHYYIIAGRWANLSDSHQKRLLFMNYKNSDLTIYTYDEVARRAYARPFTHD